jgi:hypothetical protein
LIAIQFKLNSPIGHAFLKNHRPEITDQYLGIMLVAREVAMLNTFKTLPTFAA